MAVIERKTEENQKKIFMFLLCNKIASFYKHILIDQKWLIQLMRKFLFFLSLLKVCGVIKNTIRGFFRINLFYKMS